MSKPGNNLPGFRETQLDFATHIRNPEVNPAPSDVESRRMKIYLELFFNNIENFLSGAFPITKEILGEDRWLSLAREFIHQHPSESPYFLQISEEFLTFLDTRGLDGLPDYMLELCHYEWVELSLNVQPDVPDLPEYRYSESADEAELLGEQVLNPHLRILTYRYPVHHIGVAHQPQQAPPQPTYLLVYRNRQLRVRFMESNPVTHRLLELLDQRSVEHAMHELHAELEQAGRTLGFAGLQSQGLEIVRRLRSLGIILGTRLT